MWACLTAHVCNNWTNYTLLTNIPTFMKEVLKFDIKSVSLPRLTEGIYQNMYIATTTQLLS